MKREMQLHCVSPCLNLRNVKELAPVGSPSNTKCLHGRKKSNEAKDQRTVLNTRIVFNSIKTKLGNRAQKKELTCDDGCQAAVMYI